MGQWSDPACPRCGRFIEGMNDNEEKWMNEWVSKWMNEWGNAWKAYPGTAAPSYHFLWRSLAASAFLTWRVVREYGNKTWVWLKQKREERKRVSPIGFRGAGKPQGGSEQVAIAPGHFKNWCHKKENIKKVSSPRERESLGPKRQPDEFPGFWSIYNCTTPSMGKWKKVEEEEGPLKHKPTKKSRLVFDWAIT